MIHRFRPGTVECDVCHRAWCTHPAVLLDHPAVRTRKIAKSSVRAHAGRRGWNRTDGKDLCPRCIRSTESPLADRPSATTESWEDNAP